MGADEELIAAYSTAAGRFLYEFARLESVVADIDVLLHTVWDDEKSESCERCSCTGSDRV